MLLNLSETVNIANLNFILHGINRSRLVKILILKDWLVLPVVQISNLVLLCMSSRSYFIMMGI